MKKFVVQSVGFAELNANVLGFVNNPTPDVICKVALHHFIL